MTFPRRMKYRPATILCALLLLATACTFQPTAAIVSISTDVPPSRRMTFTITVRRNEGAAQTTRDAGASCVLHRTATSGLPDASQQLTGSCAGNPHVSGTLPASFGIVPAAGEALDGRVALQVNVFIDAAGAEPAVQIPLTIRFRFQPHQSVRVPVFVSAECSTVVTGCAPGAPSCTRAQLCSERGLTCTAGGRCESPELPIVVDAGTPDTSIADVRDVAPPSDVPAADVCTPRCTGRSCGSNGCGGACGPGCAAGDECDSRGQCFTPCVPSCAAGCGDDGCGGVCGCPAGQSCMPGGTCACPGTTTACAGTCTDTMTDSQNCGACGNRCPGAAVSWPCVAGVCCSPRAGTVGSNEGTWTASSAWLFRNSWCTPTAPPGCYSGTYVNMYWLVGSVCRTVGSLGTCNDDDALYDVTCGANVRCVYNCQDVCVQSTC